MSLMVRSTRTAVVLVLAFALSTGLAACTSHGGAAVSEALVPQPPGDLQDTVLAPCRDRRHRRGAGTTTSDVRDR